MSYRRKVIDAAETFGRDQVGELVAEWNANGCIDGYHSDDNVGPVEAIESYEYWQTRDRLSDETISPSALAHHELGHFSRSSAESFE